MGRDADATPRLTVVGTSARMCLAPQGDAGVCVRLVPAPVFKIGGRSGDRSPVGSIPMRSRHPHDQAWFRDHAASCTSATFGLTNGLRRVWRR